MKTISLLVSLIPILLLNGCIGVIPVPPNQDAPAVGHAITPGDLKFIVAGKTTQAEVVARLGLDFRESPRMPVMAYSWEKPAWGWAWWMFVWVPETPCFITGGDHEEGNDWRALYLKFDSAGRVEKTEFAKLDNGHSLDEQMENWGWGKARHFIEDGAGVFNPETGTPVIFDGMKGNLELIKP